MKALLLGYGGFIGNAVAKQLDEADLHSHADGDLTDPEVWGKILLAWKPDTVFMCAGVTGGSGRDPMDFVHDNLVMHAQMFKACAAHGVKKIVALSSTTGYPATNRLVREDEYFDGDPHSAYFNPAHTRRFIERLSAMYTGIETVWLRISNAYGPGDNYDAQTSHVIAATVRKVALRHDPIIIWGDGSNVRDAVYIGDVAAAVVMAAKWPAGAYNIACGESMSVLEIADHLTNCAPYDPAFLFDTSKPSMLPTRLLNTDKAMALGWRPTMRMKDGLKRTLDWYESRG